MKELKGLYPINDLMIFLEREEVKRELVRDWYRCRGQRVSEHE